jgi:hypothetical protein
VIDRDALVRPRRIAWQVEDVAHAAGADDRAKVYRGAPGMGLDPDRAVKASGSRRSTSLILDGYPATRAATAAAAPGVATTSVMP